MLFAGHKAVASGTGRMMLPPENDMLLLPDKEGRSVDQTTGFPPYTSKDGGKSTLVQFGKTPEPFSRA